jgi:hypothetical protein
MVLQLVKMCLLCTSWACHGILTAGHCSKGVMVAEWHYLLKELAAAYK